MASINSIISIETRLVTHFSGYKTIKLHEKAMLYVLNHDFRFFALNVLDKILNSLVDKVCNKQCNTGNATYIYQIYYII